jgi:hypothetical protein
MTRETIITLLPLVFGFAIMPIIYFLNPGSNWRGKVLIYSVMAVAAVIMFGVIRLIR